MIGCKIYGSFPDNSGYGDSNRADAAALFCAGIDLSLHFVPQTLETRKTGWIGDLCNHLEDREIDYKIELLHITPDLYPRYIETGKYHIGRLVWETDKLPKEWIDPCNQMNEIWTMTEEQARIIKASGVNVPIHIFPEPLDISNANCKSQSLIVPNFNGVIFYSIFQWIERKDPFSLLTTYWKTFSGQDDVVLILKTYRVSYNDSDFQKIKDDIQRWKNQLKLKHYPPVFLISELWPTNKVWQLHKMGGTFISTSHAEGWNRPLAEAALMGNCVISTNKTGIVDLLPPNAFYPVNSTPSPVIPQSWIPWYQKDQNWLDIDTKQLGETMRQVFENEKETKERGQRASDFIKDNFNYSVVGSKMRQRLEEISRFL